MSPYSAYCLVADHSKVTLYQVVRRVLVAQSRRSLPLQISKASRLTHSPVLQQRKKQTDSLVDGVL